MLKTLCGLFVSALMQMPSVSDISNALPEFFGMHAIPVPHEFAAV
jgi:hypothetical protein